MRMERLKRSVAAVAVLSAVVLAAPNKADATIVGLEGGLAFPTGELDETGVTSDGDTRAVVTYITTANSGYENEVKGRRLEVTAKVGGKEVKRQVLELDKGSFSKKRRFVVVLEGPWGPCATIQVDATITGQAKKSTKSMTIATGCGD